MKLVIRLYDDTFYKDQYTYVEDARDGAAYTNSTRKELHVITTKSLKVAKKFSSLEEASFMWKLISDSYTVKAIENVNILEEKI